VAKRVYDFVDAGGQNLIDLWLSGLDKFMFGRVLMKLDMLLRVELDFPPKFVTDTRIPQIKELRVSSKQALRILLCKGPDPKLKNEEITLLFGAAERDSKYVPRDALERAEKNRHLVLQNPLAHRVLREVNDGSKRH
jgi:hypothetical protein